MNRTVLLLLVKVLQLDRNHHTFAFCKGDIRQHNTASQSLVTLSSKSINDIKDPMKCD